MAVDQSNFVCETQLIAGIGAPKTPLESALEDSVLLVPELCEKDAEFAGLVLSFLPTQLPTPLFTEARR